MLNSRSKAVALLNYSIYFFSVTYYKKKFYYYRRAYNETRRCDGSIKAKIFFKNRLVLSYSYCMRIMIVKRLINNYFSRARLRSVRWSRAKFTSASDRSIISCFAERLLAYGLHIVYRESR